MKLKLADGYDIHLKRLLAQRSEVPLTGIMGVRLRYDLIGQHYNETYIRPAGMRIRNTFVVKSGYEIPLRIYWPKTEQKPAVIVYFHGGGWVAGSHDSHEMTIAELAQATGAVVVSVHYRRAPENPFPLPQEDCYDAVEWVVETAQLNGWNAARMSVAGDSAGGCLSTQICVMSKRRGGPRIRHQALLYGVFDGCYRPYFRKAKDQTLTVEGMREYFVAYTGGKADVDPLAQPVRLHRSDLEGLPPAYFLNAEYDALLEEELEYSEMLRGAGVEVAVETVPGTMHGLLRAMDVCPPVRDAFDRLAKSMRSYLA